MIKHGHSRAGKRTPTWQCWSNMVSRCINKNHPHYHRYGGRGIAVCERWRTFLNFLEDMGERPEGMTLDRERNHEGYCKENCRWVPMSTQVRNRDNTKSITYNGETMCIADWAARLGVKRNTMYNRLWSGWTTEEILFGKNHAVSK